MGLDLKKMREQQAHIQSAAGGGDDKLFLYAEKLKPEEFVKPMPDLIGSLNGSYYVEQVIWWINGKMYLSNATFNEDCVIQEEYDKAKKLAEKDEDIEELLNKKNDKKAPLIQKQVRFLVPVLHLDLEFNSRDTEAVDKVSIQDDRVKVLVMRVKLMDEFHRVIISKTVNKKGGWGAMDKETGSIIQIGKEGSGLNTRYYAQFFEKMEDDDVYEVLSDDKYYKEGAIPDIWKLTKDMRKSDEFLRSAIRNYLYGEEMLEDDSKKSDEDEDEKPAKKSKRVSEDEEDERPAKSKSKRVLEEDEDEEEERPAKKAKKRVVEEDDEEEEEEDEKLSKKPKQRSVVDDIENELNNLD